MKLCKAAVACCVFPLSSVSFYEADSVSDYTTVFDFLVNNLLEGTRKEGDVALSMHNLGIDLERLSNN
jgi:hypothetical protein